MKTLRGRHLLTEPLYAGAGKDDIYYHLTPAAQSAFGLPEKFGKPIPTERRAHVYAVLLFCTGGKEPRPLFTLAEFKQVFPVIDLAQAGGTGRFFTRSYYLDTDDAGTRRLGRLLVDEGAKIDGLLEKCEKAYEAAESELPLLLQEQRFALCLITAAPEKKRRLEHALRNSPIGSPPIRMTVTLLPEIAQLFIDKEHARGAA